MKNLKHTIGLILLGLTLGTAFGYAPHKQGGNK